MWATAGRRHHGALFLKKFIGDYVHLDIAGTAILEENMPYAPKGGSGVGVRLLVEYLSNYVKK
jgi:leucyl aminopeptidase